MRHQKHGEGALTPVFLSEREAELAKLLLRKIGEGGEGEPQARLTDEQLYDLACHIYGARRERSKFLPESLFAEPAWDMLLMLFCSQGRGERLYVSSLCGSAGVPPTTALRWISSLAGAGLVEKKSHGVDGRMIIVSLSAEGHRRLTEYLRHVAKKYFPPV